MDILIPDLTFIHRIATKAMFIAREVAESGDLATEFKADKTKVTAADLRIHEMALEMMKPRYSHIPILGEEGARGDRCTGPDDYWFLMDELDGTGAFTQGLPTSVCMFALMRADQPIISVISEPFTGRVYMAEAGKGAMMNGQAISVCKEVPAHPVVDVVTWPVKPGSPHNMLVRADKIAADLMNGGFDVQMIGSIGMAVARVASGEFHATVFPGRTLHDTAPGHLLVQEAGGVYTDLSGDPLSYGGNAVFGHIFASNWALHHRLSKVMQRYLP